MKNIQLLSDNDKDFILIGCEDDNGDPLQYEVHDPVAIKIIKTLGYALHKESFGFKPE